MNNLERLGAVILVLLSGVPASRAQQKDVNQPGGPFPPLYQGESSSKPPEPSRDITVPDTRPLSGAQELTLGSSEAALNFLQPSFRFTQLVDSNAGITGAQVGYQAVSAISGALELHRSKQHQELVLRYAGGGTFYSESSFLNASFHQFGISQTINWRRWSLLLSDEFSYSPESPFNGGYGGISGLANPTASGSGIGLNQTYMPSQSIITLNSPRLANTALGQVEYSLSPRSALTFTGSYGVIRFLDVDLLNVNQTNVGAGYSHSFNARDSVAVNYGFARYRYQDVGRQFETHSTELSYGRRITGRLSWQVSAGAQVSQFNQSGLDNRLSWSGRTALQYRRSRTDFRLSYMRGVTAGSGVLVGSLTSELQAGVSRQITRSWRTGTNFGYAHNAESSHTFDAVYGGVQVERTLGRTASMYFSYNVQHQTTSQACSLPGCAPDLMRHVFGVGLEWHMRPVRLD